MTENRKVYVSTQEGHLAGLGEEGMVQESQRGTVRRQIAENEMR